VRKGERRAHRPHGAPDTDVAVEFIRPVGVVDATRRVETIAANIPREFNGVEVLKSTILRERGAYAIALCIDRDGGVDTSLCERISRYVSNRLDESSPPFGNYSIEVASAGLDRPLLAPAHYARFLGRDIRVITTLRIANRVEFIGRIEAADEVKVKMSDLYAGTVEIPYAAIKRAHLVYEASADLKKKP